MSVIRPRLDLARLAPAVHGGAPVGAGRVLDFSQSANPLGPSPRVIAAAQAAPLDRYPEREADSLRAVLAARLGLPAERVVVGSGSAELFWLVALAYLNRDDTALVVGPTFAEYARAAQIVGARVVEVVARAEDGFRPDWAAVRTTIERERPRIVFLCNPNNPTGSYYHRAEVEALLASTPGLLVLDEAFVSFVGEPWDVRSLLGDERLVVVRSLTKDHAVAGLGLGYALAAPEVTRALQWAQPPWSVNAAAQAAGLAALAEDAHVARGRALAEQAKALLVSKLSALGWSVLPSAANFLLAEVGDAAAWTSALQEHGIYLRDCTSFGLPRHVRLAARPLAECAALVAAVRAVRDAAATPVSVGP